MSGLLAILAEGGFKALFAELWSRLTGKKKDPQQEALQNALAAKQHEAEVLAAPPPDDAELDRVVHDHWRDQGR